MTGFLIGPSSISPDLRLPINVLHIDRVKSPSNLYNIRLSSTDLPDLNLNPVLSINVFNNYLSMSKGIEGIHPLKMFPHIVSSLKFKSDKSVLESLTLYRFEGDLTLSICNTFIGRRKSGQGLMTGQ